MPNAWSIQDTGTGRFVAQTPKSCTIDGCDRDLLARGWCKTHYHRWRRNGSTELLPFAKDQPCSVDGCTRQTHARGVCVGHYSRLLTAGGVQETVPIRKPISIEQRFWEKVDRSGGPDACWVWQNGTNEHGYGNFWIESRGRMEKAHRVAWMLEYGALPHGYLLHSCDNPPCVNVRHLRIGTQKDNTADAIARGRHSPPPHYSGERNPAWKHGRYAVAS